MRTRKDSDGNFLEDPPEWLAIKASEGKRRNQIAFFLRWYQNVFHLDFEQLRERLGCSQRDLFFLARHARPNKEAPGYFSTLEAICARHGADVDELDKILRWCDGIDVISNEESRKAAQKGGVR